MKDEKKALNSLFFILHPSAFILAFRGIVSTVSTSVSKTESTSSNLVAPEPI